MPGEAVIERVSWAEVRRVARGATTVRRYAIRYPPLDEPALEAAALADLAAVAAASLDDPRLRRWLALGWEPDVDPDTGAPARRAWADAADFDGLDVCVAWREAARARPHELALAWRDPGAMASTRYAVTTHDAAGRATTRIRMGPWDPSDPIEHPDPSSHRVIRVHRAPIPARLAARVVVAAGQALATLHAAGLVHGMVTTEAIAITRAGEVVIHRIATYRCRLRGAMYCGSGSSGRCYADLAPELVAEHAATWPPPVTPASDVFQLASALYELVTFGPAWRRATAPDTIEALRGETLPPVSTVHPAAAPLDAIIARSLARDPGARPTLAELVDAIDAAFPADPADPAALAAIVADAERAARAPGPGRPPPM
jgi:hypothetical protein